MSSVNVGNDLTRGRHLYLTPGGSCPANELPPGGNCDIPFDRDTIVIEPHKGRPFPNWSQHWHIIMELHELVDFDLDFKDSGAIIEFMKRDFKQHQVGGTLERHNYIEIRLFAGKPKWTLTLKKTEDFNERLKSGQIHILQNTNVRIGDD